MSSTKFYWNFGPDNTETVGKQHWLYGVTHQSQGFLLSLRKSSVRSDETPQLTYGREHTGEQYTEYNGWCTT